MAGDGERQQLLTRTAKDTAGANGGAIAGRPKSSSQALKGACLLPYAGPSVRAMQTNARTTRDRVSRMTRDRSTRATGTFSPGTRAPPPPPVPQGETPLSSKLRSSRGGDAFDSFGRHCFRTARIQSSHSTNPIARLTRRTEHENGHQPRP
jgi:hypothetical protein